MWPVYAEAIERYVGAKLTDEEALRLSALLGQIADVCRTRAGAPRRPYRLSRIATDRACASRPSARPSAITAGPSARSASGPHFRIGGALQKSSTERPEAKRAERAVGSTWFGPPT
jgi:hypothetical protein